SVLQIYAFLLAGIQALGGVHTDEAKYLLNIPYPHPPLARFLLSLTSSWPYQEFLWRAVFATLLVQAAWLVWHMGAGLAREQRFTAACAWLLCAAVVLQAGTIMMVSLTALQGLLFLVLLARARRSQGKWTARHAFGAALLWLASLFTSYHALFYAPVVALLLWRKPLSPWQRLLYFLGPIVLVLLSTAADPLLAASWLRAGVKNTDLPLLAWSTGLFQAWSVGGSILLGLTGMAGLLLRRDWGPLLSVCLVAAFTFISFRLYYGLLFTPLFLYGTLAFFRHLWKAPLPSLIPVGLITLLCLLLFPPDLSPSPARAVLQALARRGRSGAILIAGSFGHEWQYEASSSIRRYHPSLLPEAQAAVCLEACEGIERVPGWSRAADAPVEVWVKE
ncbi:MAG: hypothetical protein AAB728_03135, partial [Patescibacteria group bacterium]